MFNGNGYPHHERRAVPRIVVDYPALLRTTARQWSARIVDISSMGAKLAMAEPPRAGVQAMIQCDGEEFFCKVVWASETTCSVAFDRALRSELLERISSTAGVSSQIVADPSRIAPGKKRQPLLLS